MPGQPKPAFFLFKASTISLVHRNSGGKPAQGKYFISVLISHFILKLIRILL